MGRESSRSTRWRRALHTARAILPLPLQDIAMLPSAEIQCPYCGERIEIVVDAAADDSAADQHYIEDCQVCCRPIAIAIAVDENGAIRITAHGENEA
jgi:hypothetical protein